MSLSNKRKLIPLTIAIGCLKRCQRCITNRITTRSVSNDIWIDNPCHASVIENDVFDGISTPAMRHNFW